MAIGMARWPDGAFILAGEALGVVVTPDLDLAETRRLRNLGVVGRLWAAYWWPYGKFMRHRSLSHAPLVGTLTRAAYMSPAGFAVWKVGVLLGIWQSPNWWTIGLVIAGLCLADLLHILLDGL